MHSARVALLCVFIITLTSTSFAYEVLRFFHDSNFHDYGYFIYQSRIIDTLGSPWNPSVREKAEAQIHFPHTISVAHYLPSYFILLIPLSRLPYSVGSQLWFFFSLASLFFSLVMLYRWFLHQAGPWIGSSIIFILLYFFYSIRFNLAAGQNNLITLGLIILGTALLENKSVRGGRYLAGVAFATAALFKIVPLVLFLPLLLRRAGKTFLCALIVFLSLNALALAWFTPGVFIDFYESVRYKMSTDAHCILSFSLYSLVWRLTYSPIVAGLLSNLIFIVIVIAATWLTIRQKDRNWPELIAFWCLVFMVGSAFLGESHLVYALPAVVALAGRLMVLPANLTRLYWLFGIAVVLLGLQYYPHGLRLAYQWPFTFLLNMKLYGLFLLLGMFFVYLWPAKQPER